MTTVQDCGLKEQQHAIENKLNFLCINVAKSDLLHC